MVINKCQIFLHMNLLIFMFVAPHVTFCRLLHVPWIVRKDVIDLNLLQLTFDDRCFKQLE